MEHSYWLNAEIWVLWHYAWVNFKPTFHSGLNDQHNSKWRIPISQMLKFGPLGFTLGSNNWANYKPCIPIGQMLKFVSFHFSLGSFLGPLYTRVQGLPQLKNGAFLMAKCQKLGPFTLQQGPTTSLTNSTWSIPIGQNVEIWALWLYIKVTFRPTLHQSLITCPTQNRAFILAKMPKMSPLASHQGRTFTQKKCTMSLINLFQYLNFIILVRIFYRKIGWVK